MKVTGIVSKTNTFGKVSYWLDVGNNISYKFNNYAISCFKDGNYKEFNNLDSLLNTSVTCEVSHNNRLVLRILNE